MYARVLTSSLYGLSGEGTWAEVDAENGLPQFSVVGLADQSVREARDRIRSALENCGFEFPAKRITVNLTPANRKKDGSHYDLAIALGLLLCSGAVFPSNKNQGIMLGSMACLGELTLDGRIRPVEGALPMVIGLFKRGVKAVILPEGNLDEVRLVKGVELYPARTLREAADHISGASPLRCVRGDGCEAHDYISSVPDFSEIRGQETVKRAAQIAAAGMHGMLMVGPPGVGKTMVGKCIPGLLPPLSYEEMLEVTQIYSVAGELKKSGAMIRERPFRAPHHNLSKAALIGGGSTPRPGEISLAHGGVLFLDELPEFASGTLDALRQPIEDGFVVINRANFKVTYPSDFMLVGAMNPCRCGYYGDPVKQCTCSESDRMKYVGRVSGPLLDRIDIHVCVERVVYAEIDASSRVAATSTAELKKGVDSAHRMQSRRYKDSSIKFNSQLPAPMVERYCVPDEEGRRLLKTAFEKWDLSARSYHRLLRLSRTIADMDMSEDIKSSHVLEALQFRFPERLFR